MPLATERTTFTLDVAGRYTANTWQEAIDSTDTAKNSDARPFDFIVIGGGTFGCVLANHLFNLDATRSHRILVLEAGPFVLTEHAQNTPMLNTAETWAVPWNSDSPQSWNAKFPGLAFNIGGRSLFWGGWAPEFIDSELPSALWPAEVKNDLTKPVLDVDNNGTKISYLHHAARQIGADTDNDFIHGPLHSALRERLFTGLTARASGGDTLAGQRGTLTKQIDLEAPLAVQSRIARSGAFPGNKFSGPPLLIRSARVAQVEAEAVASGGPDQIGAKKRLMVVANTHVIRMERDAATGRRITRIHTNQGAIEVPAAGQVFLALGTIENTRMALNTLPNSAGLMGRNLMAHLRSNVTIRIPRDAFAALPSELQAAALFVKGIHTYADGSKGHYHLQITATGLGDLGSNSEAEMWQKIPDIDGIDQFKHATDNWIVITLRAIGEMAGDRTSANPRSRITTTPAQGAFDYGAARALVRLDPQPRDLELWTAMDSASDEVARIFAGGAGKPVQFLTGNLWQDAPPSVNARRDTLSSTHHESGTLWMGTSPATSVTDSIGRFHESDNLYAIGPAVLPTMGSPNPMLSGVALARRTADRLVASLPKVTQPLSVTEQTAGFTSIFDGSAKSFNAWRTAGRGAFALIDGAIVTQPGDDLGLFHYTKPVPATFTLRLQFRLSRFDDNSGVFIRSLDPRRPVPLASNPAQTNPYTNQAYVAVDTGFEIQIDEMAKGNQRLGLPDGLDEHRTGAVYNMPIGNGPGKQSYVRGPQLQPGQWYDYEIVADGNRVATAISGVRVARYENADTYRGVADALHGFIGLQSHSGKVSFRAIRFAPSVITPALLA